MRAYIIGRLPEGTGMEPVDDPRQAELVVVSGTKQNLLGLCQQIPSGNAPVVFVSDFLDPEIRELATLGISAMTVQELEKMIYSKTTQNSKPLAGADPIPPRTPPGPPVDPEPSPRILGTKNGEIIAVGSDKGGVGKTFISTNLAVFLALTNPEKKVVLVEYDAEKMDVIHCTYLLKAPAVTVMNWQPAKECERHSNIPNLFILPYGEQEMMGITGRMTEAKGKALLKDLKADYDYVVIDMGIFTDLWCIQSALELANKLILVADEGKECLTRLVSFTTKSPIRSNPYLITNRITGKGYYTPADIARALRFKTYFVIPENPKLSAVIKKKKFPVTQPVGKELQKAYQEIFHLTLERNPLRWQPWQNFIRRIRELFKKGKVSR